MGLQEPVWWAWRSQYEWLDLHYERLMLPIYCRKASHIFPMSDFILAENRKYLKLPFENTTVTWAAPNRYIRRIEDPSVLGELRSRYGLPGKFILSVTRVLHVGLDRSSTFFPGKNPETALRAFILCRDDIPHDLVFAGRKVRDYLSSLGFRGGDFDRVRFLDFVPHTDIAGLYTLADLFVLPSYYEGFGFVMVEAMACGCPVVASREGACPEVSNGAALLADPYDPKDFAEKIRSVIRDESLRGKLRSDGFERAKFFDGEKTARLTIRMLEATVNKHLNSKCLGKSRHLLKVKAP
jgi:glycosyltransferase involved in cell wall biosynthesis